MRTLSDIDSDGYAKPIRLNDWGYQAYFTKIVESDYGTRSVNEQDPETRLKQGTQVHVKWPDGTITLEKLVGEPYTEMVQDQGHLPQAVHSVTLHVPIQARGVISKVAVEDLRVKIAGK